MIKTLLQGAAITAIVLSTSAFAAETMTATTEDSAKDSKAMTQEDMAKKDDATATTSK